MSQTPALNTFAEKCRDILREDSGPEGRKKIAEMMRDTLTDPAFVTENYPASNTDNRKVLYKDSEFGFCICSHVHHGAAESKPHDHGDSWAIYGQVAGTTEMHEWRWVEKPVDEDSSGTVESVRSYTMKPGDAHVYNEGDLHSPSREDSTKLLRIEGRDLGEIKRVWHKPN